MSTEVLLSPRAELERGQRSGQDARSVTFTARSRLVSLRDQLIRTLQHSQRRRYWIEPPLFFFNRKRQCELEASQAAPSNPYQALEQTITLEISNLTQSIEVRRVARAIPNLADLARCLGRTIPLARELCELLAMPEEEIVLVLDPISRKGYRFLIQGVFDFAQFYVLMAEMLTKESSATSIGSIPSRFVTACRCANPSLPAGVPMVVDQRLQFSLPSALESNGTHRSGFAGSDHWLWPRQKLAHLPRLEGERVVLIGEMAFKATWEIERRFPSMPAECELIQVLSPFQVAERLGEILGHTVPVTFPQKHSRVLSRAA